MKNIELQKVLILGSTGMLGSALTISMLNSKLFDIYDISHKNKFRTDSMICDVTNKIDLHKIINLIKPDVVINCVGVLINKSNKNPSNAIYINSYFPHYLRDLSELLSFKLIHISTDCVFDGSKGSYNETDYKTAQDIYGLSKSLGEINDDKNLTLRTSIIGPELKNKGEGLFSWFINQKGRVNGFTESIWGGVTTIVLSNVIIQSIQNDLTGLIHVTNGEPISKFNLLNLIKEKFNLTNIKLVSVPGKKSDKSLKTNYNYFDIPTYEEMIAEMREFYLENY